MRVLRFLLSVSLLGLAATVAQADGARSKGVALPAPQSSVVVTVERGVRVWRPLGTEGGDIYPQTASVNSGSEPSVQYVTPNSYGVTGIYGGFGGFSKGQKHERRNGVGFGPKHVNVNIKGWSPRPHGPKFAHVSGHHGGMKGGGGPKHVAFVVKGGGGKPRGMGHGRGHH
jgi:hypothetical protein